MVTEGLNTGRRAEEKLLRHLFTLVRLPKESEYFCDRHRPYPPPPDWRRSAWECGDIDYGGRDRFSNILARIRSTIQESDDDGMPIGIWL
ncbi:unnamed protein product [Mesocestoides corti]|uniref:Myotubularin phosphatase domain-containing protein n=1 Tax=Mesocestoides corti TaxID=53468 RepID=A0A0R3U851_MESCO|nr:unnamed protein product [Mesocestoides corti]